MLNWKNTTPTSPGFYLYRPTCDDRPEVLEVWEVDAYTPDRLRYGFGPPSPAAQPFLIGKLMHDAEAGTADAFVGDYACGNDGLPTKLGGPMVELLAAELAEAGACLGTDCEHRLLDVMGEIETAARYAGWAAKEGPLWKWVCSQLEAKGAADSAALAPIIDDTLKLEDLPRTPQKASGKGGGPK